MPRNTRTTTAAATPAPDPGLRRKIREALCLLPSGRRATLGMVVEMVNQLLAIPVSEEAVKTALEWNLDRGFVTFWVNAELERDEWFMTDTGRVHQASQN